MKTRPAPPAAYRPTFIRCQSVAKPLTPEYWCIGETTTRFFKRTSRIESGENSIGWDMRDAPSARKLLHLAGEGERVEAAPLSHARSNRGPRTTIASAPNR
jgi:hypothetical protein